MDVGRTQNIVEYTCNEIEKWRSSVIIILVTMFIVLLSYFKSCSYHTKHLPDLYEYRMKEKSTQITEKGHRMGRIITYLVFIDE